jgi:4-amino-4-deoxy-L-arabinose transferase-like glycosyltransferase
VSALPAAAPQAPPRKPRTAVASPARRPQPARSPERRTPQLRVVHTKHAPAKAPFVLLVSLLLGTGLVLVLLVNTWLAQGAFEVRQLQKTQAGLAAQSQTLAQAISAESAPQSLAAQAAGLGLVPAPNPVFKGTDGRVLGTPVRAVRPAPPPPSVAATPTPTPTPTAAPTATPTAAPKATPTPQSAVAKPTTTTKPSAKPTTSTKPSASKPATPAATGGHG